MVFCSPIGRELTVTESAALATLNVMTTGDVAAVSGLGVGSVRVMVARARTRREEGRALPTDIPSPDVMVYRSPLWTRETIAAWLQRREAAGLTAPKAAKPAKASAKKVVAAAAKPAKRKGKTKN